MTRGSADICLPVGYSASLLTDFSTFNLGQHWHCSGPFLSQHSLKIAPLHCLSEMVSLTHHSELDRALLHPLSPTAIPIPTETWISKGRQNFHTAFGIIQLKFPLHEIQFSSTNTISQPFPLCFIFFFPLNFSQVPTGKLDPVCPNWDAVSMAPVVKAQERGTQRWTLHCWNPGESMLQPSGIFCAMAQVTREFSRNWDL